MALEQMLDGVNKQLAGTVGHVSKVEKSITTIVNLTSKVKSGMANLTAAAGAQFDARKASNASGGTGVMSTSLGSFTSQGSARPTGGGGERTFLGMSKASFGSVNSGASGTTGGAGGSAGGGGGGGGVMPVSSNGTANVGGSKFSALAIAGGAASAAWQGTPGVRDAVAYQSSLFPVAFATAGQYNNKTTGQRIINAINSGASSPFDPTAAAAMMTYSGYTMNMGKTADRMLTTAGAMFQMTGMNNMASVQGSMALSQGTAGVSEKLMGIGIATVGPKGNPKDLGVIIDQLWDRWYGGREVTEAQLDRDIAMGFIGADLQELFGSQPALYQQAMLLLRLKVKEGGRKGIRLGKKSGKNSAVEVAKKYGLNDYNSPMAAMGGAYTSQNKMLMEASEGLLSGFVGGTNTEEAMATAGAAVIEFTGPLGDATLALKGFTQTLSASPTAGPVASTVIGFVKGLFAGGGSVYGPGGFVQGPGGTTSDSITARLSKGEFVINARAAQQIGLKNLNAMNSLGHAFGSGFASPSAILPSSDEFPMQLATGGGTTISGNPVSKGDMLGSFSIPGGSITVDKRVGSLFQQFLNAWQSHPLLGGGRYDLTKGSGVQSYNLRDARSGGGISDHAGWAVDIRPDVLPDNNKKHMTADETSAVHAILNSVGAGKLGWGGDYQQRQNWDEMHVYYMGGTDGLGPSEGSTESNNTDTPTSATTGASGDPNIITSKVGGQIEYARGFASTGGVSIASLGAVAGAIGAFTSGLGANAGGLGNNGSTLLTNMSGLFSGVISGAAFVDDAKSGTGTSQDTGAGGTTDVTSSRAPSGSLSGWLTAAGFTGEKHREAWAIAMRESGGRPEAHNTNRSTGDNSYGLFQINMLGKLEAERDAKFRQHVPGYRSKEDLFDPIINAKAAAYMSQKGRNWDSWVSPTYGRAAQYYEEYAQSASVGLDMVSRDGPVNVHAGEAIVPASLAHDFREALREALSGSGNKVPVNINLNIAKASDEEAERFARKVMGILNNNDRMERLRTS